VEHVCDSPKVNVFFAVLAMFCHDCPQWWNLQVHHGAYYPNKLGEIIYILICSFLLCLFWLLCCVEVPEGLMNYSVYFGELWFYSLCKNK
jgi:hypothetical protein